MKLYLVCHLSVEIRTKDVFIEKKHVIYHNIVQEITFKHTVKVSVI